MLLVGEHGPGGGGGRSVPGKGRTGGWRHVGARGRRPSPRPPPVSIRGSAAVIRPGTMERREAPCPPPRYRHRAAPPAARLRVPAQRGDGHRAEGSGRAAPDGAEGGNGEAARTAALCDRGGGRNAELQARAGRGSTRGGLGGHCERRGGTVRNSAPPAIAPRSRFPPHAHGVAAPARPGPAAPGPRSPTHVRGPGTPRAAPHPDPLGTPPRPGAVPSPVGGRPRVAHVLPCRQQRQPVPLQPGGPHGSPTAPHRPAPPGSSCAAPPRS